MKARDYLLSKKRLKGRTRVRLEMQETHQALLEDALRQGFDGLEAHALVAESDAMFRNGASVQEVRKLWDKRKRERMDAIGDQLKAALGRAPFKPVEPLVVERVTPGPEWTEPQAPNPPTMSRKVIEDIVAKLEENGLPSDHD